MAGAPGRTHLMYTQYINRLHARSGHLWQNRCFSCPVEDSGVPAVMRYVEVNPVRAHMVRRPWRYEWSSAPARTGSPDRSGLLGLDLWQTIATAESWEKYLMENKTKR